MASFAMASPMNRDFVYVANPARVVFGNGTIKQLATEVEQMGLARVLILSTPEQREMADKLTADLSARSGIFAGARMHTPVDVTEEAMAIVREQAIDGLVAIGGGSTIGLGKAIALRTDLPQIAVPTTYAGSEMTPIIGETKDGAKITQTSSKVLPETVIYDVALTLGLPSGISGTSGINAIAHAVEALYARDRNPVIAMMAVEGTRLLSRALRVIARSPDDLDARTDALQGAWLCGICLGSVGMSLHHKLCHTLGGSFDLPHAETHSVVLPHALAYNAPAVPDAMAALSDALGSSDPAGALFDLARAVGAPASLAELGMAESGIVEAVDRALTNPYWNPREIQREPLLECISHAWAGARPVSQAA